MAIAALVLWLFTAGAGFYLLVTSNLGRARPATVPPADQPVPVARSVPTVQPAAAGLGEPASALTTPGTALPFSKRQARRAARDRFDPPSLTAAKAAPIVPGLRSLLEFAHPACGIVGLGFWLGYTLIHYRTLGWIAFGLVSATACLGLRWAAANLRAARRHQDRPGAPEAGGQHPGGEPAPSFSTRLIALHGGAAAVTFTLAGLTVFIVGR